MEPVLQSLMSGFPLLIFHSLIALCLLGIASLIYVKLTPFDDIQLIQDGNTAAALSLGGAIVGLSLPLAICLATSINAWDLLIWGCVTLVLQLFAFVIADRILKGLPKRIETGEVAPAVLLIAIKLGVAMINAAAISG